MRIELHCPAEDRIIGTIVGAPGDRIDAASLRARYEAAPGYAFGHHAVRDGVPLLCPRCANPIVLAGNERIPVVPGIMCFGPGGARDVAAQAG